jgi:hypothetical protein
MIVENSEWIRERMVDASLERGRVEMCCIMILLGVVRLDGLVGTMAALLGWD